MRVPAKSSFIIWELLNKWSQGGRIPVEEEEEGRGRNASRSFQDRAAVFFIGQGIGSPLRTPSDNGYRPFPPNPAACRPSSPNGTQGVGRMDGGAAGLSVRRLPCPRVRSQLLPSVSSFSKSGWWKGLPLSVGLTGKPKAPMVRERVESGRCFREMFEGKCL